MSARAQKPPEKLAVPAANKEVSAPQVHQTAPSTEASAQQSGLNPDDPRQMMDSLVAFLRRYLVCDDYQLTILALWIVHTWVFDEFPSVAYLDLRSVEPESGKTRCLELLHLLAASPWFATGPNPRTVMEVLLENRSIAQVEQPDGSLNFPPPFTFLLDDCQHIFGSTERQQLVAMLTSGSRKRSRFALSDGDYCLFGPKAYAGNSPLPRSLAARCIPIIIKRKRHSDAVASFDPHLARKEASGILNWLDELGNHPEWVRTKIQAGPPKPPPRELTAHEQDCAEPLLYVADAIGGLWPQKIRAAIVACSKLAQYSPTTQVLFDIRAWFFLKHDPEYMLSRDLLPLLGGMDQRPWAGWTKTSGKRLGKLLRPFGIGTRSFVVGTEKGIRGYLFKDFQDAWERYLQPFPSQDELAYRDKVDAAEASAPPNISRGPVSASGVNLG